MKTLIARLAASAVALALSLQSAAAQAPTKSIYPDLEPAAQEIYGLIWEHQEDLEQEDKFTWEVTVTKEKYDAMMKSFAPAVARFYKEHPEFFWLTGAHQMSVSYYDNGGTYDCTFTLNLPFRAPWSTGGRSIQEDKAALEAHVRRLAEEARAAGEDRYTQLGYVHDWLTHHNIYNDAAQRAGAEGDGMPWTALSALDEDFSPVCEGYAKAFYLVCDALDIPCLLQDNGDHMWNLVQMEDGEWYGVDVTYDDPQYTYNGEPRTGLVSGGERRTHFLQGEETFRAEHPLNAPEGPTLHPTAYADGVAYPSAQTVLVDGVPVEFAMYALKDERGYATNYVRLRDVAAVLNGTSAQFEVGWYGQVNVVTGWAYTGEADKPVPFTGEERYRLSHDATNVDGEQVELSAIILTDDAGGGYTYYQLRELGDALGFGVDWSAEEGVSISTEP